MNEKTKKVSTKKLVTYLGLLSIACASAVYLYQAQENRKAKRNERLNALIEQSEQRAPALTAVVGEGHVASQSLIEPPAAVKLKKLPENIQELMLLGERRAKAEALLATSTVEELIESNVAKKKVASNKPAESTPPPGAFLLQDELPVGATVSPSTPIPVGTGISFNEPKEMDRPGSKLDRLTLRYAARVDGRLTAYVSIGESGRMIPAQVGKTIDGIKISSLNDRQLCASLGKLSRCINMAY
ncbi:hypothetical protein E4188_23880 (plasmid) [Aeromonas media]|uniref:Pilus assembly protein PilP n=2 Tax=Aeromonas TaxID=642 RepID=A0ABX6P0Z1_AERME|nr:MULTISPECIES: hypothetical protein [Aeromonas]ASI21439.1 hypothetical protein CE456_00920 [Aeromonas salmonicida]QJT41532.1 hypothetical protein E4188_23880 [Aeromonas media]QLI59067.1 hypothetical protein C0708_23250 [Aeromonas caviae]QLI60295.1 hypothetical protein C1C91_22900 [Aeromonas caviae]HDN9373736.1 hypothetical protein [Aeromonas salmonicida]